MLTNWKMKSLFYGTSRLMMVNTFSYTYGGLSVSYLLSTMLSYIFGSIILYSSEIFMLAVYHEKEKNHEEKNKWMNIMDKLPLFEMIYDKKSKK
jgi:hypothetical protein